MELTARQRLAQNVKMSIGPLRVLLFTIDTLEEAEEPVNLKQREIARHLGISEATVSRALRTLVGEQVYRRDWRGFSINSRHPIHRSPLRTEPPQES